MRSDLRTVILWPFENEIPAIRSYRPFTTVGLLAHHAGMNRTVNLRILDAGLIAFVLIG
jgi:hypothetical protein